MRHVLKTQLLGALKDGLEDVQRLRLIPEDAPQAPVIRHDPHKTITAIDNDGAQENHPTLHLDSGQNG
jgi:hypothetical protein